MFPLSSPKHGILLRAASNDTAALSRSPSSSSLWSSSPWPDRTHHLPAKLAESSSEMDRVMQQRAQTISPTFAGEITVAIGPCSRRQKSPVYPTIAMGFEPFCTTSHHHIGECFCKRHTSCFLEAYRRRGMHFGWFHAFLYGVFVLQFSIDREKNRSNVLLITLDDVTIFFTPANVRFRITVRAPRTLIWCRNQLALSEFSFLLSASKFLGGKDRLSRPMMNTVDALKLLCAIRENVVRHCSTRWWYHLLFEGRRRRSVYVEKDLFGWNFWSYGAISEVKCLCWHCWLAGVYTKQSLALVHHLKPVCKGAG